MEDLTPRQIVAELDKFIVGQTKAKRAVAVALRNRYRRSRLAEDLRDEVIPKNILMIGPTGVGKTEIARRLANLAHAPFLKIEATKFTEVGYVGRDVDSMVRDLVQVSVRLVEVEMMESVRERAEEVAVDQIMEILQPRRKQTSKNPVRTAQEQFSDIQKQLGQLFGVPVQVATTQTVSPPAEEPTSESPDDDYERKRNEQEERIRTRLREQVAAGLRDDDEIEIEVEDSGGPQFMPLMGNPMGGDDMRGDLQGFLGQLVPRRKKKRKVRIKEARKLLADDAARSLIDQDAVTREAIRRAEESGIIFIDEIDKIAGRSNQFSGPDVSREGVQRDLLPIIEGSTVQTRYGSVRTNHILFIAAGAFHVSKPSDLIPELQGRLPIRVELDSLREEDFRRILTEPKNALTRQYAELLATEGLTILFPEDGIAELARIAVEVNERTENIGARRLQTIMERVLEDLAFEAPDVPEKSITVDATYVRSRLSDIVKDDELSRYIL
jgi:ATP-dependent HslUV protease ATP-binding subunit HslU